MDILIKNGLPVVSKEIADIVKNTEPTQMGVDMTAADEDMRMQNSYLANLVSEFIGTLPQEHQQDAIRAVMFTYMVLKKEQGYKGNLH